mgnify:CR=1 FL=1
MRLSSLSAILLTRPSSSSRAMDTAIAAEGLKGGWGAEVGRTLRGLYGDDVAVRAKAAAAAGSDARMSGCVMPV